MTEREPVDPHDQEELDPQVGDLLASSDFGAPAEGTEGLDLGGTVDIDWAADPEEEAPPPEPVAPEAPDSADFVGADTAEVIAVEAPEQADVVWVEETGVQPAQAPPPPPPDVERPRGTEVLPERRGFLDRVRPRGAAAVALAIVGALLLLSGAGAAYATYDYSKKFEGRILPGSSIAGTDVGGLNYSQAMSVVRAAIAPQLHRVVKIRWKGKTWRITPKELGAKSNARRMVQAALVESQRASFLDKMGMRLLDKELGYEQDVAIRYPGDEAHGFVQGLASTLDREPADAAIDYSTGWVEITPAKKGYKVKVGESYRDLLRALRRGEDRVALTVDTVEPAVTADDFDQVLLVRIGENKLYLYEDGAITRTWTVATGLPEYMTPTGLYEVTELRYMPTWVNPAPDTWGADMPASIPPGPGNPLGLRAINWSAPAIRFHGTSATYSLGYNASHGCVRMSNDDVIELYDMVEVGTPIVSVIGGELRPLYGSSTIGGEGG